MRIIRWVGAMDYRLDHFIEPFAGGASIGLAIAELDLADRVTLVELDGQVAAVWRTILGPRASELTKRIRRFRLTLASALKIARTTDDDLVSRAFRCLLLNRISRGGIMAPGAGWLKRGEDGKGIHSRWYPETLASRIEAIHKIRKRITFVEGDGLKVLSRFRSTPRVAAFVDPPYVANGRGAGLRLYRHCNVDCVELFQVARAFGGPMVITYHRSEIVKREAALAGIKCQTVGMHTAHTASKRQLILFKSAATATSADATRPELGLVPFTPAAEDNGASPQLAEAGAIILMSSEVNARCCDGSHIVTRRSVDRRPTRPLAATG